MIDRVRGYVLAVSLEPLDASTTLFFGHLVGQVPEAIRVVRYGDPQLAAALAGASAIVLVRALFELNPVLWSARVLRVPLYYFVDDNLMLLREQPGAWSAFIERYSTKNVRALLRRFSGVMLSSHALIEYFNAQRLHHRLMLFPPIEWPQHLSRLNTRGDGVCVAFFGGLHLHDIFIQRVLPAVRRLATEQPMRLIAVGVNEPIAPSHGLTVVHQPYDQSYARGLQRLAEAGVDVLVHPSVAGLRNNHYKNPHALISADAIGAVPVVSDRPPYDQLRSEGVVLLCDDSVESWHAALAAAIRSDQRPPIQQRLSDFCATHFSGSVNRSVVDEVLRLHAPPNTRWMLARRGIVRAFFLFGRLRQGLARVTRSLRQIVGSFGR